MQFLANIGGWRDSLYYLVVPFLFVLTIVVFFHELGHFLVARWCGIRVQVFSIGFGRELLGFTDQHGTRWKLAAIPLGGYVKFVGDENAASMPDRDAVAKLSEAERRDCFYYKPVWQRAAVVAAGPIANFLLAIVIFAGIAMWYGTQGSTRWCRTAPPRPPASNPAISCCRSTASRFKPFPTCSISCPQVPAGRSSSRSNEAADASSCARLWRRTRACSGAHARSACSA